MKCKGEVVGKIKHDNIRITTNSGKHIILKWERSEYRAFTESGTDMRLGAIKPDNLIAYIQENF